MPTIKQTKLGGLGIPSTDLEQGPSKFRDLRNVCQDADGEYYTRNGDILYVDGNGDDLNAIQPGLFSAEYAVPYVAGDAVEDVLLFTKNIDITTMPMFPTYSYFLGLNELVIWDFKTGQRRIAQIDYPITLDGDYTIDTTELNSVMYFTLPNATSKFLQGVFKWDGYKHHRAGLPKGAYAVSSGTGAYIRAFYITVDFKGNEIIGDYDQKRVSLTGVNVNLNPTSAGGALPQSPTFPAKISDGFDTAFIQVTGNPSYNAGTKELTIPSTSGTLPGNWIQFRCYDAAFNQNIAISRQFGDNVATLIAMQVKSSTGSQVVLDADPDKTLIYLDRNEWVTSAKWVSRGLQQNGLFNSHDTVIGGINSTADIDTYLSNIFLATFSSASISSGYILRDIRPVAYTAATYNYNVDTTLTSPATYSPFNAIPSIASLPLENVIDDTVVRLPFPSDAKYLAQQNGNLVLASDEVVYFSSTDLGGSAEVTDGLANFVPGSIKDGIITGIGATESFVFVSREKRNYAVVGNIYTGNFQVQPYREAQPGTTDFNNVISVNDTVFFSNQFGLFAATASQLTPVGKDLTGLYTKSGDARKGLDGVALGPFRLKDASYDYTRNLLSWKLNTDKVLILNLNVGQFYIWDWSVDTSFQFIQGKYWGCKKTVGANDATLYVEDSASTNSIGTDVASYLLTTWVTLDEPSLEKQFTQIKWFVKATSNLTASVFSDWDYVNKIQTSEAYALDTNNALSQKHKIKSNKSLAISISIECPAGQRMQVQGYELEYNPIQEGMKR